MRNLLHYGMIFDGKKDLFSFFVLKNLIKKLFFNFILRQYRNVSVNLYIYI